MLCKKTANHHTEAAKAAKGVLSVLKEFKKFMLRGNVIDLAVGVLIGGAFNKIVTSLTTDLITPLIQLLIGKLRSDEMAAGLNIVVNENVTIGIGNFLTVIIDFIITGFAIFLLVKLINRVREKVSPTPPPAAPTTRKCPFCRMEISIEATRCPQCTSEIPAEEAEAQS